MKQSWICILLLQYIIHYYYRTGVWSKAGFVYCSFYNPLLLKNLSMEQSRIFILLLLYTIHYYFKTGVWIKDEFV